MATPSPVLFNNWNTDYLDLLQEMDPESAQYQFFNDVIETINQLTEEHNNLEARVAALEP